MILDAIFYQLYRFYSWLPDWTPHETTIWSMGVAWGVVIFHPLNWLWIILFSGKMWLGSALITSWMIGWGASYLCFGRKGRWREIVKIKPLIHNSKKLSVALTILFMIIVSTVFISGSVLSKHLESYMESKRSFEEMIEQLNH